MKDQYDDFDNNQQFQHAGLGRGKHKTTKNEQIYGDFYQAYEDQPKMNVQSNTYKKSAYSNFKSGSKIENYAAECDIDIPQPKPKKKIKKSEQQAVQQPTIGQFNLQSFLRQYQQKQELQQIDEQLSEESYEGPYCLNAKVKQILKLVKIGEEDDEQQMEFDENMNISEMTFQQYRKLVMRNGTKQKEQNKQRKKKLTVEQKEKQKQFIESYGKGYKMLQKMGFNLSKGLGKQQKGIQKPVQAVFKTAFTTKDSELKQQQKKQMEQKETEVQELPCEQTLFQHRSRNRKINNFLIDLKNKYQSLTSKIYFYQRQSQNFDRDFQINNSLKIQKSSEIQNYYQELKKLNQIFQYGKKNHQINLNINNHKQEINLKYIHPHLVQQYKMDMLYVKNQYLRLKSIKGAPFYESFPTIIQNINIFLNNFYLQKQKQTIKGYKLIGFKSFKDGKNVINLQEDVIDLVDQEGPTDQDTVVSVSLQDKEKIMQIVEVVSQNTLIPQISEMFTKLKHIGDLNNLKILQCIRSLKSINKKSVIVNEIINQKIKPLLIRFYEQFQYQDQFGGRQKQKDFRPKSQQILPHLIIFPLFEIMDPKDLQIGRFFKLLSQKLWSLKSASLLTIIKPLLQFASVIQKQHFLNFYLAPRLLYHLQEFDLSQPQLCKEALTCIKLYKEFFTQQILKDLLSCTIVPQIVMTYEKYKNQEMEKKDLLQWILRWNKQISKIVPNFLEETLRNNFNILI